MAAAPKDVQGSEEEQLKFLDEAKSNVRTQAFQMKRCLDNSNLMEALKHASNMICELRTSMLSPKNYYALYIEAFDQLRHLESYLLEEKHGKRMAELYELVQYAGNILPRLYLLITVGSVYIKLKEAPAKDVLRDLVEMCRGVQHPTRGLFLRTYLSEITKDKLPDSDTDDPRNGTVRDSVEFILQNFTEMNKLWVRMQYQVLRDKEKREQERQELRLLVGKNIARLSSLDGVSVDSYAENVLPRLVEQIVNCKDVIAQQYLMEIIIQAFPDEFHLKTLEKLLSACAALQPTVNIKTILGGLIDRLANFFRSQGSDADQTVHVFNIFNANIQTVVQSHENMPIEDVLSLQSSLLTLTIIRYPEELGYVDSILKFACEFLANKKEDARKKSSVKQIMRLLNTPLESYRSILTVLKLQHYHELTTFLSFQERSRVAVDIAKAAITFTGEISAAEQINTLLEFIGPLVKDETDQPEGDQDDFEEEQHLVASLIHLCQSNDPDSLYLMLVTARKHFGQGGPRRIPFTLPPLVFKAIALALRCYGRSSQDGDWAQKCRRIFKFTHETITALAKSNLPEVSLRLYLQAAAAANKCGDEFETIAYEFATQAVVTYEEQISDSLQQFQALQQVIGTLQRMSVYSEDNYDALITKTALHSSKLLKKIDQCRAVYLCSHLFWSKQGGYRDGKRVLECLQKSLKIADGCMDQAMNVHLFLEILNEYLYYFENKNEAVTVQYLTGLIELVNTNIANMDPSLSPNITPHYQNTLQFIAWKKETDPRYRAIEIAKVAV
eukprot:TRINITY_DN9862_c0_g2_i1.p1 TRINITY_DN9862_c0_g2~~TRINITY_DN9862_c0_g2_i1.p1  ORF type:complete len:802 (-),score=347.22 TRINITY_DN9862_c0_g2_i1:1227-3578(-)